MSTAPRPGFFTLDEGSWDKPIYLKRSLMTQFRRVEGRTRHQLAQHLLGNRRCAFQFVNVLLYCSWDFAEVS